MNLSDKKLEEIQAKLPDASKVQNRLLLPPFAIVAQTGPDSKLDIALVCLRDASEVMWEVGYSLGQALSQLAWHREESEDAPNEKAAILLGKFYADDVALRLYAAGEHVANFIAALLQIPEEDLKPYREENNVISKAAQVGLYMRDKQPTHAITRAIQKLLAQGRWKNTMDYRNTWVHNQPPLIEGLGIVYERKERWEKTEFGAILNFDEGDVPKYNVDSLIEMVSISSRAFVTLLKELADIFFEELGRQGVKINKNEPDGTQISLTI